MNSYYRQQQEESCHVCLMNGKCGKQQQRSQEGESNEDDGKINDSNSI